MGRRHEDYRIEGAGRLASVEEGGSSAVVAYTWLVNVASRDHYRSSDAVAGRLEDSDAKDHEGQMGDYL